jgi:uridine kinase
MEFAWQAVPFESVRQFAAAQSLVAVDGRGSGGKTSLSARLAATIPGTVVVHTDDIAWNHAVLAWDQLLVEGILKPVRAGRAVSYRPPQWDLRERAGSIDVPADCPLLIVEGVGSGRRSLADHYDAVIWVESPLSLTEERNGSRVAAGETTPENYELWMAEENPFVDEQRTWERADLVVAGYPVVDFDPETEIVVHHH